MLSTSSEGCLSGMEGLYIDDGFSKQILFCTLQVFEDCILPTYFKTVSSFKISLGDIFQMPNIGGLHFSDLNLAGCGTQVLPPLDVVHHPARHKRYTHLTPGSMDRRSLVERLEDHPRTDVSG